MLKHALLIPLFAFTTWLPGDAKPPASYANTFDAAEVGKTPEELFILNGNFVVAQSEGNKLLELPGDPLHTFGFLFGPEAQTATEVSARIRTTNVGKLFPEFGVGANDTGGHRLWLLPGQDALEIRQEDTPKLRVPFKWQSGAWTHFRLRVARATDGGGKWRVEGKVWQAPAKEPEQWTITLDNAASPPPGRASAWGQPYAGTAIQFDDLAVTPVATAPASAK